MTVRVDELKKWPTEIACFKAGSCHLTADAVPELHAFALRLGLKRAWFQDGRVPHYDLTESKRRRAVKLGAAEVSAKQQARDRAAARPPAEPAPAPPNPPTPKPPPVDGLVVLLVQAMRAAAGSLPVPRHAARCGPLVDAQGQAVWTAELAARAHVRAAALDYNRYVLGVLEESERTLRAGGHPEADAYAAHLAQHWRRA